MALISVTVAAGIYVTNTIVQDSLVNEALENEAAHFWNLYQQNPQQALPNTANMLGYLATDGQMATGAGTISRLCAGLCWSSSVRRCRADTVRHRVRSSAPVPDIRQ